MPNIPVYTSRIPTPGPNTALIQAKAAEGQAYADIAGSIAKTASNLYGIQQERNALRESANLAAGIATTQADLDLQWAEAKKTADPNAPDFDEFAANFQDTVANPAIDKLGEGVTSPTVMRQLQEAQAKLRGKYRVQTTLDQTALSAAQAQQNIITLGRVQADSVYVNPETLDISIGIVDHSIKGLIAAGMDRDAALELQRTLNAGIAEAAFKGAANLNPDKAVRDLDSGKYAAYVPQVTQDEMRKYAEMQKEAVEVDKRRAEQDRRQAKQDAADEARTEWTRKLVLDPTKVDPKVIANDPRLSGEQIQVITNFQDEELRKLKAGESDEEGGKSPAFWDNYNRIFQGGFKSSDEIYALAGPKGPLKLPEVDKLVALWKGRREGAKVGNYQDDRARTFFSTMHDNFLAATGGGTNNTVAEGAWNRFFYEKSNMLDNRGDKTVDQLIDEKSPDYIGKNWKDYLPKEVFENDDVVPLTPAKPTGIWDYLGSFFSGGAVFDLKEFDSKFQDGEAGGAQGFAALTAASRAGAISPEAALEYAKKRGWVRANAPKQQVAPAMK